MERYNSAPLKRGDIIMLFSGEEAEVLSCDFYSMNCMTVLGRRVLHLPIGYFAGLISPAGDEPIDETQEIPTFWQ